MKDHLFRELIDELRDTANTYADTEQLREQIALVLRRYNVGSEGKVVLSRSYTPAELVDMESDVIAGICSLHPYDPSRAGPIAGTYDVLVTFKEEKGA